MPTTLQQADPARLRELRRHLRARHHVVDSATLNALGFARGYAREQVRAGRWQRVHRGVYCAYTGPLTFVSRCAAALAAAGPAAVLSADTAAYLHGVRRGVSTDVVHIVVPHGRHTPRLRGVRVSQSRTLGERSATVREQLPVVRLERALLTMAVRRPREARALLTDSVQAGFTVPERLYGTWLGLGNIAGKALLGRAVSAAAGGSRSELEATFVDLVRRAGLPPPLQQLPLVLEGRRLWLDVAWPELRLVVELDGKAYHLFTEDWEEDLDRQNEIVLAGWTVLRVSARALRDTPDRVVEQVRRGLDAQRAHVA